MVKLYEVLGRAKPTEAKPNPKVYRMKLYATNTVTARSRFWYFCSQQVGLKRVNGEIIELHQIHDTKARAVKNYGVWLRYDSRSSTVNMYREVRDVTQTGAVDKVIRTMAGNHRAQASSIQIIKVAEVAAKDCRRAGVKQYHDSSMRFRLLHRIPRSSNKRHKAKFVANAPTTFF